MASNDIGDWYRSIPRITKFWFTASIVVPVVVRIGFIGAYWMLLDFDLMVYHFQFWRPVAAVLFFPLAGPGGFHYLINLYFLYSYSTRLETGVFDGKPADYVFMLLFNWICLVLVGFALTIRLLMDPMILSVLYVWCQINRDEIVSFWFGTRFKAMYLPWVLLIFNMVIGQGGLFELMGILVGHLYFFLMFKYPQDFGGARLLHTPGFLYNLLPNRSGGVSGFGMAPSNRAPRQNDGQGVRHRWGQGNVLGD